MPGLIPILLALNIIVASVATPTLISGLGLGSGANGSSFKQEIRKSDTSDVKAATTLFTLSCDKTTWDKTKTDTEPAYPQSENEVKKLFDDSDTIGMARFGELCVPHDEGKSGIVFVDPATGQYDNGIEMFHLFSSHWDKRSLTALYYLYQKRFSAKGYQVECSYKGKTAPIMTLTVAGGYIDEKGQPTQLAKTGIEDDKLAESTSRQVNSPHSRGQGVDIKTFGCTIITGDKPNVVANNLGLGQDDKAQLSDIASEALAAVVDASGQDLSDINEGLAETKANSSNLNNAGLKAAERAGEGPVIEAAGVLSSDSTPSIIPVAEPEAEENPTPDSPAIPETAKDRVKDKLSLEDRAAQFLERSYEKQLFLPAGSLSKGANVLTLGRKAMYDQTGIMLSDKPSAEEMAEAAALLAAHSNPDFALLVPQEAVTELRNGNYELAYKIAGAARVNSQFSLGLSNAEIVSMAKSGVTSDELISYIERKRTLSEQDREYIKSLLDQGYAGLKNKLDEAQASREQSPSGQLLKILKNSPILTQKQIDILKNDFSNKEFRPGVADRLTNEHAPQTLIDWVNANQAISDAEAKICDEIFKTYSSSGDPKSALDTAYPSVHATTLLASTAVMDSEEKTIFTSVFGANPSPKELKQSISDGKLKVAGEAFMFSKGLQRAGFSSAQASYLGIGLAQDRLDGTDVGLAKLNNELGKKLNVTLTRDDLRLLKNGKFPASKKLAIGSIAAKTKLPVKKIFDFFDKKDGADNATGKSIKDAFSDNPKLTDKTKNMLNALTTKGPNQQSAIAATTSSAGAKAKAKSLANASTEGTTSAEANADRKSTSDKLEAAFDKGLEKGKAAAKTEGNEILMSKGLNEQEANDITSGKLKGAEKTFTDAVLAKKISKELPPGTATPEQVKLFLNGKGTNEQKNAITDGLIKNELKEKGITDTGSKSVSEVLKNGTEEERKTMMVSFAKQYGAQVLQEAGAEAEPRILMSREQALQTMDGDFSALGAVAGQTAIGEAVSRATGMDVSPQTAARLYEAIGNFFDDSPKPTTSYPSSTSAAQVGINAQGYNSGDAAQSQANQDPAYDVPTNLPAEGSASADQPPQGVGNPSPNSAANAAANATPEQKAETTQSKLENVGWGVVEDKLGFSREAVTNLEANIKDLPNNIVDYYKNFDYSAALSGIATGVILNKLIGNTLAKIDPTGGILSSFVMCKAATWIASLGISMPILLGISLLIDFKGTIQAIKGMITMALQIFTDPIGFVLNFLGFFGLGKKKPKATNAAKNAAKAAKTDTLNGELVDAPIEMPTDLSPGGAMAFIKDKAYAADTGGDVPASSLYLPSKKPSEEQFKKISRRTVDQVLEDLMLFSLAASANPEAMRDPDFLKNHWGAFMDIPNPKNKNYVIKQLVSPRAVITDAEVEAAKKLGMNDVLYAEENSAGMVGYKSLVNYARMLYGDDYLPSTAKARVMGLMQNRAIKAHAHLSF